MLRHLKNWVGALAAAILVSGLIAPAVLADDEADFSTFDLTGNWSVKAKMTWCDFEGQMIVSPTEESHIFHGDLTMRQLCPGAEEPIVAHQTSKIYVTGKQVTVQSTITEVIDPYREEPNTTYAPDDFVMTVKSANELYGIQTDRYGRRTARWTREELGIS